MQWGKWLLGLCLFFVDSFKNTSLWEDWYLYFVSKQGTCTCMSHARVHNLWLQYVMNQTSNCIASSKEEMKINKKSPDSVN